jgi:hypothetical protein
VGIRIFYDCSGFFTRPRVVIETAAQAAFDPRVFWISRLQS